MKQDSPIIRRKSRQIMVGNVPVGGDAPIAVQSMTNTETCDVEATVGQIKALQETGADIVRVSVPSMDAAEAFGKMGASVGPLYPCKQPRKCSASSIAKAPTTAKGGSQVNPSMSDYLLFTSLRA